MDFPYELCVVCHSNMNRSMEGHNVLNKLGLEMGGRNLLTIKGYENIRSFGTGSKVRMVNTCRPLYPIAVI